MTPFEAKVVRYLAACPRRTAAQVARALWPDSEAWAKPTHRHDGRAGGHGATMPMLAGRHLERLREKGWVVMERPMSAPVWSCTLTGLDASSKVPAEPRDD